MPLEGSRYEEEGSEITLLFLACLGTPQLTIRMQSIRIGTGESGVRPEFNFFTFVVCIASILAQCKEYFQLYVEARSWARGKT